MLLDKSTALKMNWKKSSNMRRKKGWNAFKRDPVQWLFYGTKKLDIYDKLCLPDKFCKRQILICKHAYDEIDQDGFYDGKLFIVNWNSSSRLQEKWIVKKDASSSKIRVEKKTRRSNKFWKQSKWMKVKMTLAILQVLFKNLLNFKGFLQVGLQ